MSDHAVENVALARCFGDKVAVSDLNLVVPKGCIFGFLGRKPRKARGRGSFGEPYVSSRGEQRQGRDATPGCRAVAGSAEMFNGPREKREAEPHS